MAGRNSRKVCLNDIILWVDGAYFRYQGTYTYPISFSIPNNSPPTIECDHGSMIWRLKAKVHRPGAFTTKLTAEREVHVVAAPGEEDTEDSENIIIERQWDSQLQYLIAISGRSFPTGGTIPLDLTIMPFTKAKVHRISVHIDGEPLYICLLIIISDALCRTNRLPHATEAHRAVTAFTQDTITVAQRRG
jgi:hypothetical protein